MTYRNDKCRKWLLLTLGCTKNKQTNKQKKPLPYSLEKVPIRKVFEKTSGGAPLLFFSMNFFLLMGSVAIT